MKKLVLVILVVAGLLFGVTPYFIGQMAEKEFRNVYSQLDKSQEFRISVTDYQRGWFSSTAVVESVIDLSQFDPTSTEVLVFKILNTISHGPVLSEVGSTGIGLVDIGSRIEFPQQLLQEMPEFNDSFNDLVTLKNRMFFDGGMYWIVDLKEFRFEDTEVNLVVNPAQFEATTTADGKIQSTGNWDGISVSDNGTFGFTMGKMTFDIDMVSITGNIYDAEGLFTGTSDTTIAEIRMTGQELPGMIELNGITINSNSTISDNLMAVDIDLGVNDVGLMGLNFTELVVNQTFSNLDIPSIQKMNALNRQMTEENMDDLADQYIAIAMTMLDKKPMYHLRQLGVYTTQGAINSEMTASLDQDLVDPNNMESITDAVIVDASGYVPEAFLTGMGVMPLVQPFVDQGYLIRDDENLTFEFSFQQGRMSLSGKPFPMGSTQ